MEPKRPMSKRETENYINDLKEQAAALMLDNDLLKRERKQRSEHPAILELLALDKQVIKTTLGQIIDPNVKQILTALTRVVYALCLDSIEDEE